MAKGMKLDENEMMEIKSHGVNTSESITSSGSIATNVKIDEKEAANSSQRSTDEILAACNPLQLACTGTGDKEGRNRSTEDINVAEKSSDIKESDLLKKQKVLQEVSNNIKSVLGKSKCELTTAAFEVFTEYQKLIADGKFNATIPDANKQSTDNKESNITEKEMEEVLESIKETTRIISKGFVCKSNSATGDITQYQGRLISLFENRRDCYKFLRSQYPELVENAKIYRKLKAERECYLKFWKILKSSKEMSISEKEAEIYRVLEELKKLKKGNHEQFTAAILADNEITADLEKDDEKKVRTKDNIGSVDHIHTTTYSTQKVRETKVEKDSNESIVNILETEKCPRNVESVYDEETQMKTKDGDVESMCKAKVSSDLKHTNEIVNVSPILTFQLSKSVKGMGKYRTKDSYLKAFKKNRGLLYSEKAMTDNAEAIVASKEQANRTNDIIIEMQKIAICEKGSTDYDSSTEYIGVAGKSPQNATEENKCKEDIDRSNDDIKDLLEDEEILTLQQEIKHCKIKDSKEKERDPITAVAGMESHEEATVTTNHEDEKNEEVSKTEKLDHEPSKINLVLEKNADIHFEFKTNGNKLIFAGGHNYTYSAEEKQDIKFEFKDVEVSFTGNQIFVSTPNSEFDIVVRKSDPVNLTNEETQTETFPNIQ